MAEVALSFVLDKLGSPVFQKAASAVGIGDEMVILREELLWIESFLKVADDSRRNRNELAKNWVREVRDVAHWAADIIDTFSVKIQRRRPPGGLVSRFKWLAPFPSPFKFPSHQQVGAQIAELKAKIQRIRECRDRYNPFDLGDATGESSRSAADEALQSRRRISPHSDCDTVAIVGLDFHKSKIIQQLLDTTIKRRCVVSIVGAGGLGKTTLARMVYHSSEISSRFETCTACVSVSQDYRVGEILRDIAKQVMGISKNELQSTEIDELKEKLYRFLKDRSYFIVLDDVWGTDVWTEVGAALPDGEKESRVLVTTRSMKVARLAEPRISPYQLPFLNRQESWELFLRKAFLANFHDPVPRCPRELEEIGHKLAKRCGGLPLALLVLGGLVSTKPPNRAAWTRVDERLDWASTQEGEFCLKILGLSYDDLPHHHLRSCFLYLGAFPKDSLMSATELIQLWVAEGFIPRTQMMEDTAQDYLDELDQRSMIQVVSRDLVHGSVVKFRIHDLFRDLCLREAGEDGFLKLYSTYIFRPDHNLCRLALDKLTTDYKLIATTTDDDEKDCCPPPSNLRSLLVFGTEVASEIFNGLRLRVIHFKVASKCGLARLPEEITSIIHLRYLRLSGCRDLRELPSSIGNLCNLQTLDVEQTGIGRLPNELGKIQTLRHMYLPGDCECPPIGKLTNLQTLKPVSARGGWIESSLEKLINIRDLGVKGLKATQVKVFLDSLRKLKRLSSLELLYPESISTKELITGLPNHLRFHRLYLEGPISEGQLPNAHEFPQYLTELTLLSSKLVHDPMATLEMLPNLKVLKLNDESYVGMTMVCTAGGFSQLQTLALRHLPGLEDWRIAVGAMPNLSCLTIKYCSRLPMLPDGLSHMTSLQGLNVYDNRPEFRGRLQRDEGEDWYKIKHVPSIIVESRNQRFE